jgi:hypothetical protein
VLKEKAQADIDRVFKGTSRTRENLTVVDELLTYWKVCGALHSAHVCESLSSGGAYSDDGVNNTC